MRIGDRIRARRLELGWTQRDLAARMGYANHSTVGRIEAGLIDPPQSKVVQFADAMGVTLGRLMGWEDQPEDLGALAAQVLKDPRLLQLVQNASTLDDADLDTVQALVASLAKKKKD